MKNLNPLLLTDFYKCVHHDQYNKDIDYLVSYYTPRGSRIGLDKVVCFNIQGFIKKYLIEYFNENFFNRPKADVCREYDEVLRWTLGEGLYNVEKIQKLHDLGYLPLEISAVPEGTLVPMRVPMIQIRNTVPGFAWVVNTIETLMSCSLWHPMLVATIGREYRKIADRAYEISSDNEIGGANAIGDFSLRGQESLESGTASSAAFMLSHNKTATIPAIHYLCRFYNANFKTDIVGKGMCSTEHSVMCSDYVITSDERETYRRLLTEVYPSGNFSAVCDSYDYWNIIDNVLPSLKDEILNRDGILFVRGDSGNPIDIVCETVEHLWNSFGGIINSKGYKVLDKHIRVIYGDSITLERAKTIYNRLIKSGFAADNVALGAGSFSMLCIEENGILKPFTRDTFGVAVKTTWGKLKDGTIIEIFKNPKTDDGTKISQKGLCYVNYNVLGELSYEDQVSEEKMMSSSNMIQPIFRDGKMLKETSLNEIRQRIMKNNK